MNKIAAAFIKAKREFAPALKDKTNPAFRSKYADLGACLEAVDDALLNNGIAVYQETFDGASGVTVETVFLHESGEVIRCGKLHVPASKQDPQGYGSALTYARRYSLMAACGIAPEDDDGNAASHAKPQSRPQQAAQGLSNKEMDELGLAIHECADLDTLTAIYKSAATKANDAQKETLKQLCAKQKAYLTQKEAA